MGVEMIRNEPEPTAEEAVLRRQVSDPLLPRPYRLQRVQKETGDTFTLQLQPAASDFPTLLGTTGPASSIALASPPSVCIGPSTVAASTVEASALDASKDSPKVGTGGNVNVASGGFEQLDQSSVNWAPAVQVVIPDS